MSGCVHACGKHHVGDLGLLGATVRVGEHVVEAVHIYADGRLGEEARLARRVREDVLIPDLADMAETILRQRAAEAATDDSDTTTTEEAAA
jgi:ferredoxin-nitrite reductase